MIWTSLSGHTHLRTMSGRQKPTKPTKPTKKQLREARDRKKAEEPRSPVAAWQQTEEEMAKLSSRHSVSEQQHRAQVEALEDMARERGVSAAALLATHGAGRGGGQCSDATL